MTAPELVEVVAEALLSIELDRAFDRNEDMVAFKEDLEACRMDARAVVAALAEAGKVQFGVRWQVGGCSGINRCTSKRHAERQAAKLIESGHEAAVVSQLTLPWGRAE